MRLKFIQIISFLFFLLITGITAQAQSKMIRQKPVIVSEWWRICEAPDLGGLNGANLSRQDVVDHGFIQAGNGKWQLWACMRGTAVGRILYRWEGDDLESGPWEQKGIALRADSTWGEVDNPEKLQAPYFMKIDDVYHCFYNSSGLHQLLSVDGVDYERKKIKGRKNNMLFPRSGRDVMIMKEDSLYFAYSTLTTNPRTDSISGHVMLRTSTDLLNWSEPRVVCEGGIAGPGPVSAESPFVIKVDGYYYLFRASSHDFKTYVYRSETPYYFGVNDDQLLVAVLPVKAPEIIFHENKYYISDLADFQGIKLAHLKWVKDE